MTSQDTPPHPPTHPYNMGKGRGEPSRWRARDETQVKRNREIKPNRTKFGNKTQGTQQRAKKIQGGQPGNHPSLEHSSGGQLGGHTAHGSSSGRWLGGCPVLEPSSDGWPGNCPSPGGGTAAVEETAEIAAVMETGLLQMTLSRPQR